MRNCCIVASNTIWQRTFFEWQFYVGVSLSDGQDAKHPITDFCNFGVAPLCSTRCSFPGKNFAICQQRNLGIRKKKRSVNPSQINFFPNVLLNFSNKIFFFYYVQGLNGCEFKTNGKSVGCIGQNILQFTCKITSVIMKIMNYAGHHPLTPIRLYKEVLHSSPPLPLLRS